MFIKILKSFDWKNLAYHYIIYIYAPYKDRLKSLWNNNIAITTAIKLLPLLNIFMHYVIMNFSVVYSWNIFISFLAQKRFTIGRRATRRIVFYTIPCLRYRVIVNQTAWRSALRASIIKPGTLRRELALTPQRVFDRGKIIYSRATIFNVLNNALFRLCAFIDVFHHSSSIDRHGKPFLIISMIDFPDYD